MDARRSRIARRRGRPLALAVALVLASRIAAAQVAVDELELHVALRPGAVGISQAFHATNVGDVPANATITAEDWDRSERGENRYYPLGTLPTGCGHHVRVFPSVLRLDPHSVQTIQVTVDSADAIPRGCYTILFVETDRARGPSPSALTYSVRYGVKIYVERDSPPSGEVTAIAVEATADTAAGKDRAARVLNVSYRNAGSCQTQTRGSIEIRRLDNSVAARIEIPEFPTLPGATRRLSVPIPRLPSGKYVLLALLDFGGQEIAAGQASLEVP